MVIKNIYFENLDIELSEPFSYFMVVLKYLPYSLVIIETDIGLIGYGEVSVAWDITGETQESVKGLYKHLKQIMTKELLNKLESLEDIKKIMGCINKNIYGNTALKAGVEAALLDLLGKHKKQPVYKLFQSKLKPKEYIVPQKVFSFEETSTNDFDKKIQQVKKDGFKIIKFKVGENKEKDIDLIKHVFKINPELQVVLDVNQGWESVGYALSIVQELEKFNIAWIEQPLPYYDYDGLKQLRKKTKIPIMVDESCHGLLDLKNLFKSDALDIVNIKLAKCGGILEMIKMINFCEKNKIKYMLGDMISSSLGVAINLHASMLGNFISFDVTYPSRIKSDLFFGLKFEKERVFIPQGVGLGVKKIIKND